MFADLDTSWYAIAGAVLVSSVAALIGSFLILQRRSLLVDMLGHSVFPGVIMGFLFAGWQRSAGWFFLGALLAIAIGFALFTWLAADPKVGDDAATAIALSGMFAFGTVLLSRIQQSAMGAQAGLNTFLTGQAALISKTDVLIFASLLVVISALFYFNRTRFKIWAFDENFAAVTGFKTRKLEISLYVVVAITVFFAVQAVGVVLASALFVLAPLSVLLWVRRFETLLWVSVVVSALGAFGGARWSAADERMPAGAAVITLLFLFFLVSWFFSPAGYFKSSRLRRRTRKTRLTEDLLKSWYYFYESTGSPEGFSVAWIQALTRIHLEDRSVRPEKMRSLLRPWVQHIDDNGFALSAAGRERAEALVRRHRLWETYLVEKMGFSPDHVHDDAERVEHFIGEDLEFRIEAEVDRDVDPHGKPIPGRRPVGGGGSP
ncbi:MAG TPA: metal ABC transporter permease [Bdellovibrionota bacterium]|jgi:manganese/zinc/iron transport system permease protein|nr:metal ABC transporter permease [Bdellovibrionota bacterium]